MSSAAPGVISWATLAFAGISAVATLASTKVIQIGFREYYYRVYIRYGPYFLQSDGGSVSWQLDFVKPRKLRRGGVVYVSSGNNEKITKVLLIGTINSADKITYSVTEDDLCCIEISRWLVSDDVSFSVIFERPTIPKISSEKLEVVSAYIADFRGDVGWRDRFIKVVHVRLMMFGILLIGYFGALIVSLILIGIKYG